MGRGGVLAHSPEAGVFRSRREGLLPCGTGMNAFLPAGSNVLLHIGGCAGRSFHLAGRGGAVVCCAGGQGVLSHSRERTKGRPGEAHPRQDRRCPGPLVAWLGGETLCCVRQIASSRGRLGGCWGAMSLVRWRPGGTVAAFIVRRMVGLLCYCESRMSLTGRA